MKERKIENFNGVLDSIILQELKWVFRNDGKWENLEHTLILDKKNLQYLQRGRFYFKLIETSPKNQEIFVWILPDGFLFEGSFEEIMVMANFVETERVVGKTC